MKKHSLVDEYTALLQDNKEEVSDQKEEAKCLTKKCKKLCNELQEKNITNKQIEKALQKLANELDALDDRLDTIDDELDDIEDQLDDLEDAEEDNYSSSISIGNSVINNCRMSSNSFYLNGKKITFPPEVNKRNISIINGNIYCDGYVFNKNTGMWEER